MFRNKRITSTVLLIGIMILFSANVYSQSYDYKDMPDNWSTEGLEAAVKNNLLQGFEGWLKPNDDISRAEVATVINRAFNAQDRVNISKYSDVTNTDWFYSELEKALHMETFRGNNNMLYPNLPITREEAFLVIARSINLEDSDYCIKDFSDVNKLSSWAKGKVYSMVNNGYIKGSGNNINPKKNITRAEFAQVMHNIIRNYVSDSGIKTVNNKGNLMINSSGVTLKDSYISGDLIIGDGVGDGDIELDDVVIEGRLLVRGGGENSINVSGNSKFGSTTIARLGGKVRLNVNPAVDIGEVILIGNDDVIFKGNYNIISVISDDIGAILLDANVNIINLVGQISGINVEVNSEVEELNINNTNCKVIVKGKAGKININEESEETIIQVDEGGEVREINSKGNNTRVIGSGEVKKVNIDNIEMEAEATDSIEVENKDTLNDEVDLYYKSSGVGMPTSNIKISNDGEVMVFSLLFDNRKLISTTDGVITVASSILEDISRIKVLFNGEEYSNINKLQWEE